VVFLGLAAGSSDEGSSSSEVPALPTDLAPATGLDGAGGAEDPVETEIRRIADPVSLGFTFDDTTPGKDASDLVRSQLFNLGPQADMPVQLQVLGVATSPAGPVYVFRTMVPAGAGVFAFHQVHRGPNGKLVKADIGGSTQEACGTHESFRGTVEDGGSLLLQTARWTEICPDGGQQDRQEATERVHADGRREAVAG
jgi:hypothetical protein